MLLVNENKGFIALGYIIKESVKYIRNLFCMTVDVQVGVIASSQREDIIL